MKNHLALLAALLALSLAGCAGPGASAPAGAPDAEAGGASVQTADTGLTPSSTELTELTVRFGNDGAPFVLHLEDNDTAKAIAAYVGTAGLRLPIYHYDDYEGWEVMQYYDIPSRYEIPSNPERVASEKAGEVYYAAPNRIVLFYRDGEISGEYTKIGAFDATEDLAMAVQNNPVVEGWSNKLVLIGVEE